MTTEPTDDLSWLTGDAVLSLIDAACRDSRPLHQRLQWLRTKLPPEQAALASQQVELRRRAATKFPDADRMLFTGKLLEQATDIAIASYKASCFPSDLPIFDLCCGLGGDSIAFSLRSLNANCEQRAASVVGVDRDPTAVALATHNVAVCGGGERYSGRVGAVEEQAWPASPFVAHIDPDRRVEGRRTSAWELLQPGAETLEKLRSAAAMMAVKLAPATEVPANWLSDSVHREWIGSRGECRQQLVWFDRPQPDSARRSATVVGDWGQSECLREVPAAESDYFASLADQLGDWLIEPHAAVLAADLAASLAAPLGLRAAAAHGGYLTGAKPPLPPASELGAQFEVLEVLRFDRRSLKQRVRELNIRRLEVKRRGVRETPDEILKPLERVLQDNRRRDAASPLFAPDEVATLVVTRLSASVVAALCRRLRAAD